MAEVVTNKAGDARDPSGRAGAHADASAGEPSRRLEVETDERPLSGRAKRRLTRYAWAALGLLRDREPALPRLADLHAAGLRPRAGVGIDERPCGSCRCDRRLLAADLRLRGRGAEAGDGAGRAAARREPGRGHPAPGPSPRRGTPSAKTVTAVQNLSRTQRPAHAGHASRRCSTSSSRPLFIGVLFARSTGCSGALALGGALILVGMAVITDRVSRKSVQEAGKRDQRAQGHLNHMIRQRAAIVSMGMTDPRHRAVATAAPRRRGHQTSRPARRRRS